MPFDSDLQILAVSLAKTGFSPAMAATSACRRLAACDLTIAPDGFACAALDADGLRIDPIPGGLPCTATNQLCQDRGMGKAALRDSVLSP